MAKNQRGAVSIFIVIFTALLVTVVTTSFIQIMMRNQQQAANNDLAQSAYDSALAGVEDAKRALIRLKQCTEGNDMCENSVKAALASGSCDTLQQANISTFSGGEVRVGAADMNQAYTCVKVVMNTPSYEGKLGDMASGDSEMIPLKGVTPFNQVRISWFNQKDIGEGNSISFYNGGASLTALPSQAAWPTTAPPVMRTHLIQYANRNLQLDSLNGNNSRTLFLYPNTSGAQSGISFAEDSRRGANGRNTPKPAYCANSPTLQGGYFCSTTLSVPNPIGGTSANREAYLVLASVYKGTSFKLELLNSGTPVDFDGVQPIVDATGRASDLFRRVKARVSVSDNGMRVPFPEAALSVSGDICKDFFVTNDPNDYIEDTDLVDCGL